MKSTTIKVVFIVALFWCVTLGVLKMLDRYVGSIEGTAPDALHFIGFVALIPMIGAVGGKLADRKTAYIKNRTFFKPMIIAAFIITYLSLVPWILTFFIAENTMLMYVDWAIVLTTAVVSFFLFSILLAAYINE